MSTPRVRFAFQFRTSVQRSFFFAHEMQHAHGAAITCDVRTLVVDGRRLRDAPHRLGHDVASSAGERPRQGTSKWSRGNDGIHRERVMTVRREYCQRREIREPPLAACRLPLAACRLPVVSREGGECLLSIRQRQSRQEPIDMPHLAAGARVFLAVVMQERAGVGGDGLPG